MDYQTIIVSKEAAIGIITLNRPEALNAINAKMASEILHALDQLEGDDSVKCLIFTGSEKVFSAGVDIKEMSSMTSVEMIKTNHFFPLWNRVGFYSKPIVAALSGHVLGGGLELAMCCDILVASETTKFGQPEINIGVIPGGGGSQRLTRAMGKYRAMEMILTGVVISSEEARAHGLVNRVVPVAEFMNEAKKVAQEVASKAPIAAKLAKQAVNKALEVGLREGLEFEKELFYVLFSTEDKSEGMKAFFEKRKPQFTGK